ncbi:hypothetical protein MAUB1S_06480 [Mycolicibacterium aubagnense]
MSIIQTVCRRPLSPITIVWLTLSAALSFLLLQGNMPNGDADDLLKLQEIRHLLQTGDPFDRTLTGIAQPEPLVSHWPWIVDAPYALVATVIAPFAGMETAISTAAFIVPLLLLLIAVTLLFLVIREFKFEQPGVALVVAALAGLPSLGEFQPWRIDYHNLQMIVLLGAALLMLRTGQIAAGLNGVLAALSLAISAEMVPFLVLPMGFYALRFILGKKGAEKSLRAYGASMAVAGVVAFFLVVGPHDYASAACDRYSLLQLTALMATGIVLAGVSAVAGSWWTRAACLLAGACLTAVLLVFLFPQCSGGPLAGLDNYVRDNWLLRIDQERDIFHSRDFVSPDRLAKFSLAILGWSATCILAIANVRRNHSWVVLALFSTMGLMLGLVYLRYFRYFPLFAGPGLALLIYRSIPARVSLKRCFRTATTDHVPNVLLLAAPGIAVIGILIAGHLVWPPRAPGLIGLDIANACEKGAPGSHFSWPDGARLFAPPDIGVVMLEPSARFEVVAIPFHTSAHGIERVLRFFDPATSDPARLLDETGATHVVVCRVDETALQSVGTRFPLASGLATGKPPAWLTECPSAGPLRIYRHSAGVGPAIACPIARNVVP